MATNFDPPQLLGKVVMHVIYDLGNAVRNHGIGHCLRPHPACQSQAKQQADKQPCTK